MAAANNKACRKICRNRLDKLVMDIVNTPKDKETKEFC